MATLRKSEVDLRQALIVSPSSINKTNNIGQTALHLAVEWPRGMELLLQAGADVDCKDRYNQSPLEYAIKMSLVEPTRLLAHSDCSLVGSDGWFVLNKAIRRERIANLSRRRSAAAEMVVNLLVDLVTDRRQRLYDLAKQSLPVSVLDRLCHDSYLPGESASRLYSALIVHGTAVPLALDPGEDEGTLFHQIEASSRVAERLWKAGFRDIDGRDSLGRTPLMCSKAYHLSPFGGIDSMLEYVAWLLEKGADFYAKHDLTLYCEHREARDESGTGQLFSATALHFVAYKLGSALEQGMRGEGLRIWVGKSFSETSKEMLQRILVDNVSDACMCACSISGCNALTMTTKGYMEWDHPWEKASQRLVDLWANVKNFCGPLKISEFLRMMTFEELGMTHTCCYLSYPFFKIKDKAEIDEIHDEEAEDLQKLEELLDEFEAKRHELDIPFAAFVKEYWQPRMDEVRNEGTLDEDALREIGVEVH